MNQIIPPFELSNRFCYLLSLQNSKTDVVSKQKNQVYQDAMSGLVTPVKNETQITPKNNSTIIMTAINFLNQIAQSERNKELKVINKYIDTLNNNESLKVILQSNSNESKDIKKLLEELKNFSNNPESIDVKSFYIQLISLINIVRNNIDRFKARLQDLQIQGEAYQKNILLRSQQDLNSLFNVIARRGDNIEREINDSFSAIVRNKIFSYMLRKYKDNTKILSVNGALEMAKILIEFYDFISPIYSDLIQKTKDEQINILTQQMDTFLKNQDQDFLNIEHNLEQQQKQLQLLKKVLKLSTIQEAEDSLPKIKDSKTRIKKGEKIKTAKQKNTRVQMIWDIEGHGFLYEALQAMRHNGINIEGTPATDTMTFDFLTANIQLTGIDDYKKEFSQPIEEIGKISQLRKNRLDNLTDQYKQYNFRLRAVTADLEKILSENNISEDFFVFHESLKLYKQIEEGSSKEFHGRKLNIYNALDSLYTANNIAGLELMNPDLLYGICVNLDNFAIGGKIKPQIENYLSIFAGLLMFDDIQNIALDAANQAINNISNNSGDVYHIHLYLLNDIYIPGSLLLTSIAKALEAGYSQINSNAGAYVKIINSNIEKPINSLSSSEKFIKSYKTSKDSAKYDISNWGQFSNVILDNTKIQIIFLTTFFQFIEEINKYMGNN